MALKIKFSKDYDYVCPQTGDVIVNRISYDDCYVCITNTNGNKKGIIMDVNYYFNSEKNKWLLGKIYSFTPSVADGSKNFIAQGYDYLKTLDEFKDAEDC